MANSNTIVGARLPIWDAAQKASGRMIYAGDMTLPRMLHGKILFSPHAHAKIISIDTSKAEALPGVRAVCTYENTTDYYFNSSGEEIDGIKTEQIFPRTMRYIGDHVAAVAADTEEIAQKALKLIDVEYEILPVILNPNDALKEDAYPIHEGGNLSESVHQECGDVDSVFATAAHIYEDTYHTPAIHHGAIETHCALADFDSRGALTVYCASQDIYGQRMNLSRIFGLPMSHVRVVTPPVGGAFGGKIDMVAEPVASALAIRAGRPVRLFYSRREDIPFSTTRHEVYLTIKTATDDVGNILGQELQGVVNAGGYASITNSVSWAMCGRFFNLLKAKDLRFHMKQAYTNTPLGTAMRGFGSPQLFIAQQCQMQKIAKDLGISMVDMLRLNLTMPDGLDYRFDAPHGNARVRDCLDRGLELSKWDEAIKERDASQAENGRYRIGLGIAAAAHGNGVYGVHPDGTGVTIKLNEDGSAVLATGVADMGNGSVSLQRQLAADTLGLDIEKVTVIQGDTDTSLWDLGNYSSRGTFVSGHAAMHVAGLLKDQMLEVAAKVLDAPVDTITFENGMAIAENGASCPFGKLAMTSRAEFKRELACTETFSSKAAVVSYGVHLVKVQVDTETGASKVLDYTAVHDVGRALNPMSVEGQIEGAVQMGLGYALTESILRDAKGKVTNASFRQYKMFRADEMPPIHIGLVEDGEESGPHGGKSIGECSVAPSAAAIINAVSDAIGVAIQELPATPAAVLKALGK